MSSNANNLQMTLSSIINVFMALAHLSQGLGEEDLTEALRKQVKG